MIVRSHLILKVTVQMIMGVQVDPLTSEGIAAVREDGGEGRPLKFGPIASPRCDLMSMDLLWFHRHSGGRLDLPAVG